MYLPHLIPIRTLRWGCGFFFLIIFQMWKLGHREVGWLALGHTAGLSIPWHGRCLQYLFTWIVISAYTLKIHSWENGIDQNIWQYKFLDFEFWRIFGLNLLFNVTGLYLELCPFYQGIHNWSDSVFIYCCAHFRYLTCQITLKIIPSTLFLLYYYTYYNKLFM